jgi:hypothetical protein
MKFALILSLMLVSSLAVSVHNRAFMSLRLDTEDDVPASSETDLEGMEETLEGTEEVSVVTGANVDAAK